MVGAWFACAPSPSRADILVSVYNYPNTSSTGAILRYQEGTGVYLGVLINGVKTPEGLAFGPDGKLYVCESDGIHRYLANGTPDGMFITNPTNPPGYITFGSQADAYLVGNGGIARYDMFGNQIGSAYSISSSTNVTLAPNRYLYFASSTNNIWRIPPGTISPTNLFNDGAPYEDGTEGIAVDPSGNLYASISGGIVYRWTAPITSASRATMFASVNNTDGSNPLLGLCFDRNGDLIAGGSSHLNRIHPDGTFGAPFGGTKNGNLLLGQPAIPNYPAHVVLTPGTAPALYFVTPGTVTSGVGDTAVKLSGNGFLPNSQVFYTTPTISTILASTYVNGTTLTAVVPKSLEAYAGTATITVSNFLAGGGTSQGLTFTIIGMPHLTVSVVTSGGTSLTYTIHNVGDVDANNLVIQNLYDADPANDDWYYSGPIYGIPDFYPFTNLFPLVAGFDLPAGQSATFYVPDFWPIGQYYSPPSGTVLLQVYIDVNAYGESRSLPGTLSTIFSYTR
jgi:sugar lactone lactonase YvrE